MSRMLDKESQLRQGEPAEFRQFQMHRISDSEAFALVGPAVLARLREGRISEHMLPTSAKLLWIPREDRYGVGYYTIFPYSYDGSDAKRALEQIKNKTTEHQEKNDWRAPLTRQELRSRFREGVLVAAAFRAARTSDEDVFACMGFLDEYIQKHDEAHFGPEDEVPLQGGGMEVRAYVKKIAKDQYLLRFNATNMEATDPAGYKRMKNAYELAGLGSI